MMEHEMTESKRFILLKNSTFYAYYIFLQKDRNRQELFSSRALQIFINPQIWNHRWLIFKNDTIRLSTVGKIVGKSESFGTNETNRCETMEEARLSHVASGFVFHGTRVYRKIELVEKYNWRGWLFEPANSRVAEVGNFITGNKSKERNERTKEPEKNTGAWFTFDE